MRIVDGDGNPLVNRWIDHNHGRGKTDAFGVVSLSGLEPGVLELVVVADSQDRQYTWALFPKVAIPSTLEVVLRRCGRIRVVAPRLFRDLEHDIVLRAFDMDGREVDVHTIDARRHRDLAKPATGVLRVYADGRYRIVLEDGGRSSEALVDALVGREVEVAPTPR